MLKIIKAEEEEEEESMRIIPRMESLSDINQNKQNNEMLMIF